MRHELPVTFVVGASRSGTTMLNHILGGNSRVLALNELHFLDRKWSPDEGISWDRRQAIDEAARLLAVARRSIWQCIPTREEFSEAREIIDRIGPAKLRPLDVYDVTLSSMLHESGMSMVIDQTPRNVFLVADLLGDFPESHAVQIVRDPRAVIHSQRNRWRQKWLGAGHTPWRRAVANWVNYHPITASKLWLNAYRAGQQLLQHSRFTRVKYEDLLMSPDDTVRKLCADLGLEFEASMLDIPQVGSSHRRHDGPGKGVVRGAADSWRGCQPHSDTWICQLMTAEARAELGYESIAVGTPILGVLVRTLLYPFHLLAMLLVNPRLALRVRSISKRQSPERR